MYEVLSFMTKETNKIESTYEVFELNDLHYAQSINKLTTLIYDTYNNNEHHSSAIHSKQHESKWVDLLNTFLHELDNDFLLINFNDVFRIIDSFVDKIKTLTIVNYNQKSIKILVDLLFN